MESDSDDVVMDVLPLACKRDIIMELVANPTLPTERLNGNNAMRQGSFEDIIWKTEGVRIYAPYNFPYQIRILSFLFRFFIFYKFLPLQIYLMSCLELSTLFYLAWQ